MSNRQRPFGLQHPASRLTLALLLSLGVWLSATSRLVLGTEETSTSADDAVTEAPIDEIDRTHWAYRPLLDAEVPAVTQRDWCRNPVDAFILAELEARGLTGAREADRFTLIRRVTIDLTGLPPSLADVQEFTTDARPDAYERLVERLLVSPAYGERAAQHWLDLARFAETDGFEHDKVRPDAWKYRDWVVQAFNTDLPYDDFLRAQLAGDEWQAGQQAVATMFCLAGPDMPDVNDQAERRHYRLNELTATVGAVFLGMQIGCAECHDHKYDPISQADFYRLRAVFEPALPTMQRDKPYLQLASQKDVVPARFWIRGDHRRPGPAVAPAPPRIAVPASVTAAWQSAPPGSSVRAALAETLVSDAAPITARVIANRLWQQHFVRGLCETSSDFGLINSEPTHPELLDWLARDLLEQGWSLKHLHRRLVLSATYRQISRASATDVDWPQRLEADPDLRWLSRSPRRRLDGEALRDALLEVSGQLHREAGGPGVRPPLPDELVSTLLKGQWPVSEQPRDYTRRSLYLFARRNLRFPLFEAFDRPDANASCAARNRSTTAPQALVLWNSELSQETAARLAQLILAAAPDTASRINWLYLRTLSRTAEAEEHALLAAYLEGSPSATAWTDVCLALINSSEFLYCD